MKPRTLLVLVMLGAASLAGGWYFGAGSLPGERRAVDAGVLMFPDLAPRLRQASRIEITHQAETLVIARTGGVWGLADRDGYTVLAPKLRGMLTALTELRLVEPRTADPARYGRLGVEDPSGKDGDASGLRVLDGNGQAIATLIVGHRRVRTQGTVPDQIYVRRPADTESWLAEGSLQVDADPLLWLDRDVVNIDNARIATVTAASGDAVLAFARRDNRLALITPADHPPLDDYKLDDLARALELLTFQDVQSNTRTLGASIGRTVFATSDGLTVTATVFAAPDQPAPESQPPALKGAESKSPGTKNTELKSPELKGRDILVRFEAAGEGKAKDEAARLAAKFQGWTFRFGAWKERSLSPTIDALRAPPPPSAGKPEPPKE